MTAHEVIGRTCRTCGVPADVVATWQRPQSKGHPLGSLEQIPYCAAHALAVMNGPTPPRSIVDHDDAVHRRQAVERDERRRRRAELARDQGRLGEW